MTNLVPESPFPLGPPPDPAELPRLLPLQLDASETDGAASTPAETTVLPVLAQTDVLAVVTAEGRSRKRNERRSVLAAAFGVAAVAAAGVYLGGASIGYFNPPWGDRHTTVAIFDHSAPGSK